MPLQVLVRYPAALVGRIQEVEEVARKARQQKSVRLEPSGCRSVTVQGVQPCQEGGVYLIVVDQMVREE